MTIKPVVAPLECDGCGRIMSPQNTKTYTRTDDGRVLCPDCCHQS